MAMDFSPDLITGGILTIFGTIAGGIIGWRVNLSSIRTQVFLQASANFRSEFIEALHQLHPKRKNKAVDIIKENISKHEIAKDKFRPYLEMTKGSKLVNRFDKAWEEYCYKKDERGYPDAPYLAYVDIKKGTPEGEEEMKELARNRINSLLEFAK